MSMKTAEIATIGSSIGLLKMFHHAGGGVVDVVDVAPETLGALVAAAANNEMMFKPAPSIYLLSPPPSGDDSQTPRERDG
jgi:hypothetical protein